jgi:hypothetical protein
VSRAGVSRISPPIILTCKLRPLAVCAPSKRGHSTFQNEDNPKLIIQQLEIQGGL